MTIDFQKIADTIEKAPKEIQDLMFSIELEKKIQNITYLYTFDEEKSNQIIDEIGYIILGLKPKSSFNDSLIELGIDNKTANLISREIEVNVFTELYKTNVDKKYWHTEQNEPKIILDVTLKNRLKEICTKYSLDEKQTLLLENLVSLGKKDNFIDSMVSELGISRLLAEQMTDEVEKRVFEYAIKEIGGNSNVENDIPEIRPEIVPMVEKGEVAHDIPHEQVVDTNKISVPRYVPDVPHNLPIEETVKAPEVVVPTVSMPAPPTQTPIDNPLKKYGIDPYREPLE